MYFNKKSKIQVSVGIFMKSPSFMNYFLKFAECTPPSFSLGSPPVACHMGSRSAGRRVGIDKPSATCYYMLPRVTCALPLRLFGNSELFTWTFPGENHLHASKSRKGGLCGFWFCLFACRQPQFVGTAGRVSFALLWHLRKQTANCKTVHSLPTSYIGKYLFSPPKAEPTLTPLSEANSSIR